MADIVSDAVTVVVIGNAKVGKSCIVDRFVVGSYSNTYMPTTGVDFNAKVIPVDDKTVSVNIWDTSGQEDFSFAAERHLREADGFIFVYDVTDVESFMSLRGNLLKVQQYAKAHNLPKVLVGNKTDLRHKQVVGAARAREFGIPEGMEHVEVSARDDKYINVVFYVVTSNILRFRQMGTIVSIGLRSDIQMAYQEASEADTALMCAEMIEDTPEYTHLFKILIIGAPRTGKTSMRLQYCKNHFSPEYVPTAGFDYSSKCLLVDGDSVKVQVWDVSGDKIYEQTRRNYYKGADAYIILYDVTNPSSFTEAEHMLKDLDLCGHDQAPKLLVGNKLDLKRKKVITYQSGKDFSDGWRLSFIETSSRYGDNIDTAFSRLIVALKRHHAPWRQVYHFS